MERNLLRRRLRAAVNEGAEGLAPGAYLLRTEPDATELSYADLAQAALGAMAQAAKKN